MNRFVPIVRVVTAFALVSLFTPQQASAQAPERRVHVGGHLATAVSGEFDETDIGAGARLSWQPVPLLGVEGELTFYPGDLGRPPAFDAGRFEGLFGATVGPRVGALRPFAKLRPGFLRFREASEPVACILIFPPPLSCRLAAGETMFALDVGGGVEWFPSAASFVRFDAGDRLVRYPSPATDTSGTVRDDGFFGHDFRLTIGAGVRF
jgi:hypothetical protein